MTAPATNIPVEKNPAHAPTAETPRTGAGDAAAADAALVERTLGGDREAFGALFDRYQPIVYRLALSRLGDAEAAGDVVQETFLAAWRSLDRLREPAAFGGWLGRIATNLCSNERRRQGGRQAGTQSLDAMAVEPTAATPHPAESLDGDKQRSALRKAVAALPRKYRDVVELHYTRECSCEKTAGFLGLSSMAVRARLHRARRMIVEMLEQEGLL